MTKGTLAPRWRHLAEQLHQARISATQLTGIVRSDLPSDTLTAYAVQEATIAMQSGVPRAWKIGAPSRDIQVRMGFSSPFAGPIFEQVCFQSGVAIQPARFTVQLFEPEVAIVLGKAIPGGADITIDDARNAIASYHPALEILSFRIENAIDLGPGGLISDYGLNGGLVLGPSMPPEPNNFWSLELETRINGRMVARRLPPAPETDPALLLLWLARHLEGRGRRLRAGDIITTGSQAGVIPYKIGDYIEADYGSAGSVTATIGVA